jgi:GT2 family glycosyltransferase
MARRSTFEALGGFDSNLRRVEDVDFAIRLARVGGHFVGCPEVLYCQHATEGSDKTPLINLHAELQLVEKHADYLIPKRRYSYACDWFKIRYYHFSSQRLQFLAAVAVFLLKHPATGLQHLLRSALPRWLHERGMQRERGTV